MSLTTIFTRNAPKIASLEFDAVLEDTLESTVDFTQYPIESGANVADHGIILPRRWTLTGAVSNNPLKVEVTDFLGGVVSNLIDDSGVFAEFAGISAGLLAGSNDTRGSAAYVALLDMQASRVPFDIDCGDITLTNYVITSLSRTKDPSVENGLIFVAEMQELPTLLAITGGNQPKQYQLREGSREQTSIAAALDKGQKALQDVGDTINDAVSEVLA